MLEWYDKENKDQDEANGNTPLLQNGKIKAPDYSTRARK